MQQLFSGSFLVFRSNLNDKYEYTYYIYSIYPILTEEGACDSALVKPAKVPEGNLALAGVYRAGCIGCCCSSVILGEIRGGSCNASIWQPS